MPDSKSAASAELFATTCWSRVAAAGEADPAIRRENLNYLFARYWRPIYAFIRHAQAADPATAEDLTQEFMVYLLETDVFSRADRGVGRFRTFLKVVLRRFLVSRRRWETRAKRRQGHKVIPLDLENERWLVPLAPEATPEEVLDRQWAKTMLQVALDELEENLHRAGREKDWLVFQAYSEGVSQGADLTYADVAARLGLSEAQVGKSLMNTRKSLRDGIRRKVMETVTSPQDAVVEMRLILQWMP